MREALGGLATVSFAKRFVVHMSNDTLLQGVRRSKAAALRL